ncbi:MULTISPECIES: cystathionine beta-lyase [unclassified Chelatococcus]|uniref:cystathionine beta-lyase n=1 Tax=unclassified Chelatococcus TaxID=2638111 RepID=UPI001BCDF506|nr:MULTISPECIES: cystathionine beta-lyase [unclassified Chelatococcus]MBS7696703.1 cystathionine beta-lyase [Chelatococcus sp. YT9]MBX3555268.1 cystathionine beta-lyase [Chelatococcus sp.]
MSSASDHDLETRLLHAGRSADQHFGAVNPPVYHASTILSPTYAAYEARLSAPVVYGRRGTPTTQALEVALAELEGAEGALLAPSGVAAIALVLSAYVTPGAEILVPDAVYEPVKKFCAGPLLQYGAKAVYYNSLAAEDLSEKISDQTRLIWLETPASQTFEMQDTRAIVAVAQRHGIPTAIDNTWATGYFHRPLSIGVDIAVQAATKYIGGHSDIMMGAVAASGKTLAKLTDFSRRYGYCVGGDDAYLALRGLRTLSVRLDRHHANAMTVARWLESQHLISRVMYPALPTDPGHSLWQRDFTGASGLFGFVLRDKHPARLAPFFDGLRLLGMGGSWGGFESLLIPTWPEKSRSLRPWSPEGQTMRIHVGLESPDDIIADLEAGFARWEAA